MRKNVEWNKILKLQLHADPYLKFLTWKFLKQKNSLYSRQNWFYNSFFTVIQLAKFQTFGFNSFNKFALSKKFEKIFTCHTKHLGWCLTFFIESFVCISTFFVKKYFIHRLTKFRNTQRTLLWWLKFIWVEIFWFAIAICHHKQANMHMVYIARVFTVFI